MVSQERVITPTQDGKIIDCRGAFQTWGCGCPRCLGRDHPLDLGARISRAQLDRWAAQSGTIDRSITCRCISCASPDARLYAGGWFCAEHSP